MQKTPAAVTTMARPPVAPKTHRQLAYEAMIPARRLPKTDPRGAPAAASCQFMVGSRHTNEAAILTVGTKGIVLRLPRRERRPKDPDCRWNISCGTLVDNLLACYRKAVSYFLYVLHSQFLVVRGINRKLSRWGEMGWRSSLPRQTRCPRQI